MTLDRVLPGLEHLFVVLLLLSNPASVLQLGELGSSFLEHALLEFSAHSPFSLAYLLKDIGLVSLACHSRIQLLLFVLQLQLLQLCIQRILFFLLLPLFFLLLGLLEHDIVLAVRVYILEQIDSRLVFLSPGSFTRLPLLGVFGSHEIFNHALVCSLVLLALVVVLLQLDDLAFASLLLHLLQAFQSCFSLERLCKHLLVAILLGILSKLANMPFLGIMLGELEVALSVQQEALVFCLLFFLVLDCPLGLKHFTLSLDCFDLGTSLQITCLLLPLEHGHGVRNLLLLLNLLLDFAFKFLLAVKLPQLRVDLLLKHPLFL